MSPDCRKYGAICHTYDRMHRTTILLTDELDRRLSDAARRQQRSRTEILRQALSAFLEDEVRPRPRSIGLGRRSGRPVTSETVKEAIRAEWREGSSAG
jgi:predicted transcriptional regulator